MLNAPLFTPAGQPAGAAFPLPADYFDGTVHQPALHQAVKTYRGNQRQGTAATKTRARVSGGNQKPWRQKGTGRARQGTIRAPHWRGGGIVFGPHPRDYRAALPAKVRQLARRSALNARAREGSLYVLEGVSFAEPKTRQMVGLLTALGLAGKKVLLLTDGVNRNAYLSGRNLSTTRVLPYAEATAYDALWADAIVVERGALGGGAAAESAGSPAERPAAPDAAPPPPPPPPTAPGPRARSAKPRPAQAKSAGRGGKKAASPRAPRGAKSAPKKPKERD